MVKRILGLDLGVSSIGWALVDENVENPQDNKIIKLGVRVTPLSSEEKDQFVSGASITTNAKRTEYRSNRRRLQRFKLRRRNLLNILLTHKIITKDTILSEVGKNSTFQTQRLRARAAEEKIELEELAKVLFLINKKRGYRSNRKIQNSEDEGLLIDNMSLSRELDETNQTPGQYVYNELLEKDIKHIPDFYKSDLQRELNKIWEFQKRYYPDILTDEFRKDLEGKGKKKTVESFLNRYSIDTAENKEKKNRDKKIQAYQWRVQALSEKLEINKLAYVIADINNNIKNSSGYLGDISDRSKEINFSQQTIGQYLYKNLLENPHFKLKNKVFFRQDYIDEFEKIWDTQAKFHIELTQKLKTEIRDQVIFYQRKLKSQKGLISLCEFESREIEIEKEGKMKMKKVGSKVAPKSSHLFQEFKIWQILNNVEIRNKEGLRNLNLQEKELLFNELNYKGNLPSKACLEILGLNPAATKINYKNIEGNQTNEKLYNAYLKILEIEGVNIFQVFNIKEDKDEVKMSELKVSGDKIRELIKKIFKEKNIDSSILDFNAELEGKEFEKQASYRLWHLLYSYELDNSSSGNEKLYELLEKNFGFKKEHSKILSKIVFPNEYSSLSTKAMRKIYPYIRDNKYSDACLRAGYNHSKHSLTKEEMESRALKERLEILPKNSLRNPAVEKIINQMINLVNTVVSEYGKIDVIRVELARELKKNAKQRKEMKSTIDKNEKTNREYKEILRKDFAITNPSKNDITRYKLYLELDKNAYKDLYSNTKIEKENLFTNKYDIDHIIPQSKFFDDSFSNKVLVPRKENLEKGNMTAYDFMEKKDNDSKAHFLKVIKDLLDNKKISPKKYENLMKKGTEIGDGFIERNLKDTQYIAKKAKQILLQITRDVETTTGEITAQLRKDWGLINVMKELNLDKYRKLGLVEYIKNSKGEKSSIIRDWSKRNDHRHHAMDALTVSFTTRNHIQYLNYLNAIDDENHIEHRNIWAIKNKIIEQESKNRKFKAPMLGFRCIAKKYLSEILVSYKINNKVVTLNTNKTKRQDGFHKKIELTPRGSLHKETIYGRKKVLKFSETKISPKLDEKAILSVTNQTYRYALLNRLKENGNDPKKAFSGKNALKKKPIYLDELKEKVIPEKVKTSSFEIKYTTRKPVTPENFKDDKSLEKILDLGVKRILKERMDRFNGNAKEAFSNLDKDPIWINKEKGIVIKTVTITGRNNVEALHYKKDHLGKEIFDERGQRIPVDFMSTGNNHHLAVYLDENGKIHDKIVTFYEAVSRVNQGLPIIDKNYKVEKGYKFLMSLKCNEMFVFPGKDFDPDEVDLLDEKNLEQISRHLFRVQKISKTKQGNVWNRLFMFRHHLDTTSDEKKELYNETYKRISNVEGLRNIIKVRINHIGKIVHIGEY